MKQQSIAEMITAAEEELEGRFKEIDLNEEIRTRQILGAFREEGVSYRHFSGTTGYGYDDIGRDTLERIYGRVFHAEAGLMRPHVASGTAALSLTLFGMTRPGDHVVSATGMPYDTLLSVIGIGKKETPGNLAEMGITFDYAELKDGEIDLEAVEKKITGKTTLVIAQRSRGYAWRPSLMPEKFRDLADMIHRKHPGVRLMVDNCYGEFVCDKEPTDYGADLCVGSLIKNPGGGIAPTGGYVVGSKKDIERIAGKLTAPGLGRELGSYESGYRLFYQGLFMAPHTVAQALKTAMLTARVFENLGYETTPPGLEKRADIIQAIKMLSAERLVAFCQGIQAASPVDSMAEPEPWDMPGYDDPVVMAAGTFVAGASIELSADGPIRPPYTAYMQGGLTYAHGKIALREALERMAQRKCLIIDK
ncbi:MAG: methionine gamma-lyase family protein [Clostridia bacterium]|nr:methionine gamma-lyase family protein [Clostridia bacterium]